jgi:hypothetical protein
MTMNFYLDNGYLDIPKVDAYADKHGVSFVLIIGKRQVGKTYGVLLHELDSQKEFILMRRTGKELSLISKGVNSPFEAIKGYENRVNFLGSAEDSTMEITINETASDGALFERTAGLAVALNTIANIRGFNGRPYKTLVYDEAIPESHVYKIPHEDEAFLNAYMTINGNRELDGEPPLRCYILANSNKLDCAILKALNLTDVVERMTIAGEEFRLLKERGIMIFLPESRAITEKHKKTALFRAIGGESDFTKMALDNEFSHNDFSDVGRRDLAQYRCVAHIGNISLFKHKAKSELYACNLIEQFDAPTYPSTEHFKNKFSKEFPSVRAYYMRGRVVFQSATVKSYFIDFILNK